MNTKWLHDASTRRRKIAWELDKVLPSDTARAGSGGFQCPWDKFWVGHSGARSHSVWRRDTGPQSWVCTPGSCSEFSQRICRKLLLSIWQKREGIKLHYKTLSCTSTRLRTHSVCRDGCCLVGRGLIQKMGRHIPCSLRKTVRAFFLSICQD